MLKCLKCGKIVSPLIKGNICPYCKADQQEQYYLRVKARLQELRKEYKGNIIDYLLDKYQDDPDVEVMLSLIEGGA